MEGGASRQSSLGYAVIDHQFLIRPISAHRSPSFQRRHITEHGPPSPEGVSLIIRKTSCPKLRRADTNDYQGKNDIGGSSEQGEWEVLWVLAPCISKVISLVLDPHTDHTLSPSTPTHNSVQRNDRACAHILSPYNANNGYCPAAQYSSRTKPCGRQGTVCRGSVEKAVKFLLPSSSNLLSIDFGALTLISCRPHRGQPPRCRGSLYINRVVLVVVAGSLLFSQRIVGGHPVLVPIYQTPVANGKLVAVDNERMEEAIGSKEGRDGRRVEGSREKNGRLQQREGEDQRRR